MERAAQLVLLFGGREALERPGAVAEVAERFPNALIAGCSTAGEICGDEVVDGCRVATAVAFDDVRVAVAERELRSPADSERVGAALAADLASDELAHLFVFSEGIDVNGSALVEGLAGGVEPRVAVSGGLSADGERFERTVVVSGRGCRRRAVLAVGLYGAGLRIGAGSLGGWDPFGPERLITRAKENVLYELDGRSALELYRLYLGEQAGDLPAAGLLFPLALRSGGDEEPVVRTILAIDEGEQSLTFAGSIPEGGRARLMKANFDRLIDGATDAAQACRLGLGDHNAELALLVSCVGRRMVLKQRTEEEVEAVREVLGPRPVFAGFYSYGEISPFTRQARCALHNQTMTVTTLAEV